MRSRRAASAILTVSVLAPVFAALCGSAAPASAYSKRSVGTPKRSLGTSKRSVGTSKRSVGTPKRSVGTPEQVAWVRRAADNFLAAELAGNGAGACAILNAPLRASSRHQTCTQRWDAKLLAMLRKPGTRARLHDERRAVASARVVVHGDTATITLPRPLMNGPNRFLWTENCWMLES
jgi:hypothetical protein